MAWLTGLAGKAENLLNKIDQNTAAVLSKDRQADNYSSLTEVTWSSLPTGEFEGRPSAHESTATPRSSVLSLKSPDDKDEDFMSLLSSNNNMDAPSPTSSSLIVEHPTDNTDSISEFSARSGTSSPGMSLHSSTGIFEANENQAKQEPHIIISNGAEHLNGSLLPAINYANDADQKTALDKICQNYESKLLQHKLEIERLTALVKKIKSDGLEKYQTDSQKEINCLKDQIQCLEGDRARYIKDQADLKTTLERTRSDLDTTRSELEQHRARALKTLQEKEKLISELRSNSSVEADDTNAMELNLIRQEREALREENQQILSQLKTAREELVKADFKFESLHKKATEANSQAQDIIASERRRRSDLEEELRAYSEELRGLKELLSRQSKESVIKTQKLESEISRLRSRLGAASTPSSQIESRLTTLTQTLVLKQQALESLTTERNALRLQLEKTENEYRMALGNAKKNLAYNYANDTDDAKAQVPTFLIESPFDTGVARRVKRAYSTLDSISIRTGVFLRRYPLARILVLIYMVLLQFWVFIVLLWQSPDAHCSQR